MQLIDIKPLSVNEAYNGQRTRSKKYNQWRTALTFMLQKKKLPPPPYKLVIIWGLSNMGADWDGPIKAFQDVLFDKYGLNDNIVYRGEVEKVRVPKGEEFILYDILHHDPIVYKDGKFQSPAERL